MANLSPGLRVSRVVEMYRVFVAVPEKTVRKQIEGLLLAGLPE